MSAIEKLQGLVFQKQVLALIQEQPRSNAELRHILFPNTDTYVRELDKTLQSLRKQEYVRVVKGRWFAITEKTCPTCSGKGRVKA